jgi:hypothetical protein
MHCWCQMKANSHSYHLIPHMLMFPFRKLQYGKLQVLQCFTHPAYYTPELVGKFHLAQSGIEGLSVILRFVGLNPTQTIVFPRLHLGLVQESVV